MLYISLRLPATVLRNCESARTVPLAGIDDSGISELMVGTAVRDEMSVVAASLASTPEALVCRDLAGARSAISAMLCDGSRSWGWRGFKAKFSATCSA